MERIRVLDVVALTEEELPPDAYEAEFSDDEGRTYATAPVRRERLIVLRYQPAKAA